MTWLDHFGMTRCYSCGGVRHGNRDLVLDRCRCPIGDGDE